MLILSLMIAVPCRCGVQSCADARTSAFQNDMLFVKFGRYVLWNL